MGIRTAIVTNYLPAPANSGALIRSARLARALSKLGDVSLYCRAAEHDLQDYAQSSDLACFSQIRRQDYRSAEYAQISQVFTTESMNCWANPRDPLGMQLVEDHQVGPFDAVICEQLYTANVMSELPGIPIVLDEHNIESAALASVLSAQHGRTGSRNLLSDEVVRVFENQAWERSSLIVCTTDADAAVIRSRCHRPVCTIPNGTDINDLSWIAPSRRVGTDILFIGAYFWAPNSRAAKFLAKDVLPRVQAQQATARVILCGKSPGPAVGLLKRPGVEITGTVPSSPLNMC